MQRWCMLVTLTASLQLALVPACATAQQMSLSEQLIGTWSLVSMDYVRPDGNRFQTFGGSPKGIAIFARDGHFIIAVMRADRPKFAANDRMKGTADEHTATVQGTMTYFGTYSVNKDEQVINIHIAGSSFPNWDGTNQKRVFRLSGDALTLTNPVGSTGGGSAEVVWRRAK